MNRGPGVPAHFEVRRHADIARDLKQLGKRFRTVSIDLLYAERLLATGITLPQTNPYKGFGNRVVYKTRVENTSIASGKSKGYRLVYEIVLADTGHCIDLILLYDHKTRAKEDDVRKAVHTRLGL